MKSEEIKLSPCPFCGEITEIELDEGFFAKSNQTGALSVCCDCGVIGPTGETMEEAVSLWENRVKLKTPPSP